VVVGLGVVVWFGMAGAVAALVGTDVVAVAHVALDVGLCQFVHHLVPRMS